jgi:hypothetical protein
MTASKDDLAYAPFAFLLEVTLRAVDDFLHNLDIVLGGNAILFRQRIGFL